MFYPSPRRNLLALVAGAICLSSTTVTFAQSVGPIQSGPIAVTPDDQLLVSVNPEANTVTVFDLSTDSPLKIKEVRVGRDPESVAIHPDGIQAFVANAQEGSVSMIDLGTTKVSPGKLPNPVSKGKITVGAEPMAIALSPNGTRLYVANSASGNLMVFDTTVKKPVLVATVDLSAFGTAPRSIAITNDGDTDDTDETIFVPLFFAQLRPGLTSLQEGQDDQREGRVVAISAATNTALAAPNPILLEPMANTGFNSNGRLAPSDLGIPDVPSTNPQTFTTPTGAFPNQLASISLHPAQPLAYIVSTGASPNGPLRFTHMAQGLVSVIDTMTRTEFTSAQTDPVVRRTSPLNMNQGVNLATTPAPRLFLTNPVAIAWQPNSLNAWVAIQHADLIVRLDADVAGIPSIGAPLVAGPSSIVRVDLQNPPAGHIPGKAPRGIAINSTSDRAYVFNFISRSVSTIDISNPASPVVVGTAQSSDLPKTGTDAEISHAGAELFYTGRGPQGRMSSDAWGACIVCHPAGRTDNVTWMFDAGPRQTISLDGMFNHKNPHEQRILNWSAVRDENQDFELNTRGVFGGRGLIDDDRLFLAIGGANGFTPTDSALVEQFQQFTGAVTTTNDLADGVALPALLSARRDFGVATLADDRVFIIGGRNGSGAGALVTGANAVLEFNPRTNALISRSAIGFTPRHSLGVAAVQTNLGPRIYAIGGYGNVSPATSPLGIVEEFNPDTNSWRTVAPLLVPVAQFGITVAGGINTAEPLQLIHVVSGNTNSETTDSVVNPFPVQRFQADPLGPGTWTGFNPAGLTLRRNLGVATALRGASSRIFVIGGYDGVANVIPTVEEYFAQAVTMVATPHTDLPAPRASFGIGSTLSSNQIYVMGGVDAGGNDTTSIFEYSVATNGPVVGPPGTPSGAWVTRGNLSVARRGLGVSNPPGVTNLLPVANTGRDIEQDAIADWIEKAVRASRAPVAQNDPAARRGRKLFGQAGLVVADFSCASCHGGSKWSRSEVDYPAPPSPEIGLGFGDERVIGVELRQTASQPEVLNNVGTFTLFGGGRQNEIRFNGADISQTIAPLGANGFNIPSLLSVSESAPYFYSGLAQTLEEVLNGSQDNNGGVRQHFVPDAGQRADLIQFLKSIDEKTPIFP